jgi:hypothetical protein
MLQIAVIKPNAFTFDGITFDDIANNKFLEMLKPFVEIVKVDASTNDELLKNMVQYIGVSPDEIRRTHKCFESKTKCAYLMYVATDETTLSSSEQSHNANNLGRFLSEGHEPVLGSCVILNTKITTNCDITFDGVAEIIRARVFHTAVMISPDGSIKKITFNRLPIEGTHLTENNSRCVQIDFLNKVLCVFLEYVPSDHRVNKIATILCKKMRIHGDVVIGMLTKYPSVEVIDVEPDTLKKILCIRSNLSSKNSEELSEEAMKSNFFSVLEKYAKQFDNVVNEIIPDDVLNGPSMNSTL